VVDLGHGARSIAIPPAGEVHAYPRSEANLLDAVPPLISNCLPRPQGSLMPPRR
jgi:hypothetical protein